MREPEWVLDVVLKMKHYGAVNPRSLTDVSYALSYQTAPVIDRVISANQRDRVNATCNSRRNHHLSLMAKTLVLLNGSASHVIDVDGWFCLVRTPIAYATSPQDSTTFGFSKMYAGLTTT